MVSSIPRSRAKGGLAIVVVVVSLLSLVVLLLSCIFCCVPLAISACC